MRTAKIISIVCWLVTALILIGLAIWFLSGNLFGFRTGFKINTPMFSIMGFESLSGPFNEAGTYTVPAGDIDSLNINWLAGSATITPYDGDVIKVTEFAQRDLKDNEKFICSASGGTLDVRYCTPGMNINILVKNLEVLVPKSLADKLDVLDVDATSADLEISDFNVDTFSINETSGTSKVSNITAVSSEVHSVSGTIDITDMTTSTLTMITVSGEIQLDNVIADTLISNTTSGGQELSGTFKDVDAGSISGELRIASSINPDRMKCGTTSGGITVTIPGGSNDLTVSYSTVSGDFDSDIAVKTGGSGAYRFTSVSGNIHLKAA